MLLFLFVLRYFYIQIINLLCQLFRWEKGKYSINTHWFAKINSWYSWPELLSHVSFQIKSKSQSESNWRSLKSNVVVSFNMSSDHSQQSDFYATKIVFYQCFHCCHRFYMYGVCSSLAILCSRCRRLSAIRRAWWFSVRINRTTR